MKRAWPFQLEKWYFDFAMPTGEIVFFFLAQTQILGRKDSRLSFTVASPLAPPIHRSLIFQKSGTERSSSIPPQLPGDREILCPSEGKIYVRTSIDDLSLDLVFVRRPEALPPTHPMVIARRKRQIRWEPVHCRSIVRGLVSLPGRSWRAEGYDGYVDRLVSDVCPPFTPVSTLFWGRLHHREGSLVYAVIPRPRPCALLTWSSPRGSNEFDSVEVTERGVKTSPILGLAYPPGYTLMAESASARLRLDVETAAPAVETEFVGREEIRSGFVRRVTNFLAGNPRGIKFFSRGRVRVEGKGEPTEIEDVAFFSEVVRFS